ncbi:glycosyltransferase family 4 protein [Rossellomorea vietnamensis]|uniref:Glycosyltransferase family 4 protein n=1 Tax=Rossellomorea vietnamensis TaxID=218284 RepID=A0ACD4C3T0_9BACI|nr:glycosyltransferase family 4 protein [Rossellomorea vietnamensis]UXH43195.1 glycosyltransferase family 4 protein [Rossellomorea vietnamensis]
MKKKILYIQPYASHVGGVDSVLLQLIDGLNKNIYEPFVVLPNQSPYVEKYQKLGATVLFEPLAVFGKPTSWKYYIENFYILIKSIGRLKKIVKNHKIDLIHSHKMELMGGNIVGKILNVPTVQTIHELPRNPLIAYKAVGYLNHLFNDAVIVLCNRSKSVMEWGRLKSNKVRKIYNGISIKDNNPLGSNIREELNLSKEDKIAITVARLSPMKGIEFLLDAANELKKENPNLKFVIIGDVAFEHEKEYKEVLINKSKKLNLEGTVFFLGLRRDVPSLLNQSDIFILPSVYDIFPTVILEAMSCSIPIVGTDVGGVPEMVRNNTGIIVPASDSRKLAQGVKEILNNDYKLMGKNGRELLEREFTQEKYVSQTVEIYEGLLKIGDSYE